MERWQQQLRKILDEQGVVEEEEDLLPEDRQPKSRPGFSFVMGKAEVVNVTEKEICFLPSRQENQGSEMGNCRLMDARYQLLDRQAVLDDDGWVGAGIWVESNKPYVKRAISRCCSYWSVPDSSAGVLATRPSSILAFYDLLVYEYAHRYCLTRTQDVVSPERKREKQMITLVKTTVVAQHCCGRVLLRELRVSGRPRRRGACIVLENGVHETRYLTVERIAIAHCSTCGKRIREVDTKVVGVY